MRVTLPRARESSVVSVVAAIVFLVGCQHAPTTGGDISVTTERLAGCRLTDIHNDLSWTFSDTDVVVENKDQPIPSDLVQELLGNQLTPTIIKANWRLDEKAGILHLFNTKANSETIDGELRILAKPAGQVRANIGNRQYNVFRNSIKGP